MRFALLLLLAACARRSEPPSVAEALHHPVAELKLARDEWRTVVVDPYRDAYDDYVRAFDAAAPAIAAQLEASMAKKKSMIITRQHYAGDPELTRGQARTRWALPVQAPADVVDLDGAPIDAVFVRVGDRYRAIVGVDQIAIDRARGIDESCAGFLETLGSKTCQEVGWEIADAALRADRNRFVHACSLAAVHCTR